MGDESIAIADTGVGLDGAAPLLSGDGPPWPGDSPRNHPHTGKYYLAVQPWDVIFSGRITGWSDQMNITYSSGGFSGTVKAGMTAMLEQDDGTLAYIRIKTAPSGVSGSMKVAENDHLDWDYNKIVYVLNRFELWPVHPRVTFNGGLTFYKDYDIAYTDQNENFYPVPVMGPPAAAFLSGGSATIQFSGEHSYTPDGNANASWAWTFENGDPATYNAVATSVTWTAAGVYLVSMTITNAHGKSSIGYRYVYIFDRTGSDAPHTQFSVGTLTGNLADGGWTCSVEVWLDSVDKNDFPEGSQVILFAEEEWGGNSVASKGMFIDRNNIKLVGWIEKNTVVFSSETGSVSFSVVGIHRLMKNCEIFSCALDYDDTPTAWTQLKGLNAIRAFHHLIYWQSTLMTIVDVFLPGQLVGAAPTARLPASWDIKFQDFGDGALWSQLANLGAKTFCVMAADRCSTFYIGRDPQTIEPVYIGDVSTWLILTKTDWHGDAEITIQDEPVRSRVTLEGVQYVGATDTATPQFSYAPGEVPVGRGQMEVMTGAVLSTVELSGTIVSRLLAIRNNPLPHTALSLLGNYGPCIDIAPFRWVRVSLAVEDTPRAIVWEEREFLPTIVVDHIAVTQGGCSTSIVLVAYSDVGSGVTIVVPEPRQIDVEDTGTATEAIRVPHPNIFDTGGSSTDPDAPGESVWTDWPFINDVGGSEESIGVVIERVRGIADSGAGADAIAIAEWGVLSSAMLAIYAHEGFSASILSSFAPDPSSYAIAWDDTNVLTTNLVTEEVYRHVGFSSSISDSFSSPGGRSTGLAWDGTNVLSADYWTEKHYQHIGFSTSINSSYTIASTRDLTWDGENVISTSETSVGLLSIHYRHDGFSASITDSYAVTGNVVTTGITWAGSTIFGAPLAAAADEDKHYKYAGFSATIFDSYVAPGAYPVGIAWITANPASIPNVIGTDSSILKHCRHFGFSATITDSYTVPDLSPRDVTWDGTNVLSAGSYADKHYKHSGFSASITDSYTAPATAPSGITWDGTNVLSVDSGPDKNYKHSGFSASIIDSYSTPASGPRGITWDGTNVLSLDSYWSRIYKHSGFSASIIESIATPGGNSQALTWDGTNMLSTAASDAYGRKHYKHSGFSASIIDSYTLQGVAPYPRGITWDGRYA